MRFRVLSPGLEQVLAALEGTVDEVSVAGGAEKLQYVVDEQQCEGCGCKEMQMSHDLVSESVACVVYIPHAFGRSFML